MGAQRNNRPMAERPPPRDGRERGDLTRSARSVTVNLAESPRGRLKARELVSERQFEAGERLRQEWETAQLPPSVTMKWDAPPAERSARGAPILHDPTGAQLAAKRCFDAAVAAVGSGLSDMSWRIVCAGEAMGEAEQAFGWSARSGRLVLRLALYRLADFYRIR